MSKLTLFDDIFQSHFWQGWSPVSLCYTATSVTWDKYTWDRCRLGRTAPPSENIVSHICPKRVRSETSTAEKAGTVGELKDNVECFLCNMRPQNAIFCIRFENPTRRCVVFDRFVIAHLQNLPNPDVHLFPLSKHIRFVSRSLRLRVIPASNALFRTIKVSSHRMRPGAARHGAGTHRDASPRTRSGVKEP